MQSIPSRPLSAPAGKPQGVAPVTVLHPEAASDWLLVCEHSSFHIPDIYENLGLPAGAERGHIGGDIGAAELARALGERLDATVVLAGFSRLLIDLNRPPRSASSIPERSEATDIPGNLGLSEAEIDMRIATMLVPFHDEVARIIAARRAAGRRTRLLTVHSFTPVFLGTPRPWHLGILSGASRALAQALLDSVAAQAPELCLALDEPYSVDIESDYAIPVHGDGLGLDALLLEIRNDQLRDAQGVAEWAGLLHAALDRI